jgi:hypothetical protein
MEASANVNVGQPHAPYPIVWDQQRSNICLADNVCFSPKTGNYCKK